MLLLENFGFQIYLFRLYRNSNMNLRACLYILYAVFCTRENRLAVQNILRLYKLFNFVELHQHPTSSSFLYLAQMF